MLLIPSVEVAKGEPHALPGTLHLLMMAGGLAAVIPKVESETATAKSNIRALVSPIRGCCVENVNATVGNLSRCYGIGDSAEVTAIKQICMAIFAHCDNETGRCCAWHVHQQWTGATQIEVELI